ncbi:GspH/FimT family protein [Legionella sp.]|uniref:GspH/FimT family protein n=1 Tax=Legionella sp. TaxID=459 RepID=UPI003CC24D4C
MKIKGFTLLELLIILALIACLSVLGTASYSYLLRKNEQQVLVDELRTAVQYAKLQALILGKTVSLTPLDASLNWVHGMKLSTWNKKTNNSELLYQWQWHHPGWELTWSGARSSNRVIFSNNPTRAISNGHFTLLNADTRQNRVIILNRLGRIKEDSGYSLSLTR